MIFALTALIIVPTVNPNTSSQSLGYVNYALITVVVDNDCNPYVKGFECPWGLSIFIQTPQLNILFDTGPSPQALKHNLQMLGIDMNSIEIIVLSHEHADHVGGLPALKLIASKVALYIPNGFPQYLTRWIQSLGFHPYIVTHTIILAPGIALIGPLTGPPNEIALLVNVRGFGAVLITGCSHPGIVNFVKYAEQTLHVRIAMVIGGFHTFYLSPNEAQNIVSQLLNLGVKFIAPLHCSGEVMRKILEEHYPEHYIQLYVGESVYLDP